MAFGKLALPKLGNADSRHIKRPNQSIKPTAPLRYNFSVFATTPCRGLSLSCYAIAERDRDLPIDGVGRHLVFKPGVGMDQ